MPSASASNSERSRRRGCRAWRSSEARSRSGRGQPEPQGVGHERDHISIGPRPGEIENRVLHGQPRRRADRLRRTHLRRLPQELPRAGPHDVPLGRHVDVDRHRRFGPEAGNVTRRLGSEASALAADEDAAPGERVPRRLTRGCIEDSGADRRPGGRADESRDHVAAESQSDACSLVMTPAWCRARRTRPSGIGWRGCTPAVSAREPESTAQPPNLWMALGRFPLGCGQPGGRQVSIGAQSGPVLPSFSSSLVNSGVGLTSGVPGAIGRDAQVACSAA